MNSQYGLGDLPLSTNKDSDTDTTASATYSKNLTTNADKEK